MAVGAQDSTFGGFGEDSFFPPVELPDGRVDRGFLGSRVVVVKFQAGRMILAAPMAFERGLQFREPLSEGLAAFPVPLDLRLGVIPVPIAHVVALVFTTLFGILDRHGSWLLGFHNEDRGYDTRSFAVWKKKSAGYPPPRT
jgi:hypothetical protein